MINHINIILSKSTSNMDGDSSKMVANNLFEAQYDAEDLIPEVQKLYRTFVENLLFVCCRDSPEIHPAVDFLTTKINNPDWTTKRRY